MADNPLKKKIGPLEGWQWLAIVGGGGLTYYLYKKSHESKEGISPEEEEKILGGLDKGTGGGGSGGGAESTLPGFTHETMGVPGSAGPAGEAGIAGPAGDAGPQGEAPSAGIEARVSAIEEDQIKNNPKTTSHNGAPQANPKGWTRNAKGELYRVVTKGKDVYHEYKERKGPSKILKVGEKKTPPKKTKRPKPTPVGRRIKEIKAPAKHKTKHVVHR
jgi:hypothetical protein